MKAEYNLSQMKFHKHWFRQIGSVCLAAVVALVLAGCVTTPAPIKAEQTLDGTEGAVVVKLIGKNGSVWDTIETLSSLSLFNTRTLAPGEHYNAYDNVTLTRTNALTNSTVIFSGMVRPGTYRITHAAGFRGSITYTFPFQQTPNLSEFDVKTGQITMLGTLLVQPLEGNRFVIGYIAPDEEFRATVRQLYPVLAEQAKARPVNTFWPSAQLNKNIEFGRRIARIHTGWNSVHQDADGTYLSGGKMGSVVMRKPGENQWRLLNVGALAEVRSVYRVNGGLLAAGEEGLLRYSQDDGRTWAKLTPPDPGLIEAAVPLKSGKILALGRRDGLWTMYVSDSLENINWRKLNSFKDGASLNIAWLPAMCFAWRDGVGVMMPNGDFYEADGERGTATLVNTGPTTSEAYVMPNGTLFKTAGNLGSSRYTSSDQGKTWSEVKFPRFSFRAATNDANTIYTIAAIDPGFYPGPYGLKTSRDGGKTWVHTGTFPGDDPVETLQLAVDRVDSSLLAFMTRGRIMRSSDEGKTWSMVADL